MTNDRLVWVDVETTGLDENECALLEVASIITDLDFNETAAFQMVIYQPPEVLANMNEWCKRTHGKSGLTDLVLEGTPIRQVENNLINFFVQNVPPNGPIVLSGNSVSFDLKFLRKKMPTLAQALHYRVMDVSSFKELFFKKYGIEPHKKCAHRALDDIRESIDEMKLYDKFISKGVRGE